MIKLLAERRQDIRPGLPLDTLSKTSVYPEITKGFQTATAIPHWVTRGKNKNEVDIYWNANQYYYGILPTAPQRMRIFRKKYPSEIFHPPLPLPGV